MNFRSRASAATAMEVHALLARAFPELAPMARSTASLAGSNGAWAGLPSYRTKSLEVIAASVVPVSLICMSAARLPPVFTSTMTELSDTSLMRT